MPVVQSKIFIAHATRVLLFCFRPVLVSVNLRPLQPDTQEEPCTHEFFLQLGSPHLAASKSFTRGAVCGETPGKHCFLTYHQVKLTRKIPKALAEILITLTATAVDFIWMTNVVCASQIRDGAFSNLATVFENLFV